MKRNFDAALQNLDGSPMKTSAEDPSAVKLKTLCVNALLGNLEGDDRMTGEDKLALYQLAGRINKGGVVDISTEELTKLKARLAKGFGIAIYGPAAILLETDYAEDTAAA
jgi:hypothetical protein